MIQTSSAVVTNEQVAPQIFVLTVRSPEIASTIRPGQFINIKVTELGLPLLRRPFSVYHVLGENISIIFNVIGLGTKILSTKRPGEVLDIIGPLGCSYHIEDGYSSAFLVAGGLGVAPLPLLTSLLKDTSKSITTFLGSRSKDQLVSAHLQNVFTATDDGSEGYHGTVVDLLRTHLEGKRHPSPKIFACGPNAMLNSLSLLAKQFNIPCEVSLESAMACGIGICQGCPVEHVGSDKKYALICKEVWSLTVKRFEYRKWSTRKSISVR